MRSFSEVTILVDGGPLLPRPSVLMTLLVTFGPVGVNPVVSGLGIIAGLRELMEGGGVEKYGSLAFFRGT